MGAVRCKLACAWQASWWLTDTDLHSPEILLAAASRREGAPALYLGASWLLVGNSAGERRTPGVRGSGVGVLAASQSPNCENTLGGDGDGERETSLTDSWRRCLHEST